MNGFIMDQVVIVQHHITFAVVVGHLGKHFTKQRMQ
ncbi:Uncharacterised protein [Vibrio cholerae]|nr:Uncharacterised protein [Vibrio cholerae]